MGRKEEEVAERARGKKQGRADGAVLVVEQYRSGIACPEFHKRTLRALGLRRMWQRVRLPDNPAVRGMIATVPHLVRLVEEAGDGGR